MTNTFALSKLLCHHINAKMVTQEHHIGLHLYLGDLGTGGGAELLLQKELC